MKIYLTALCCLFSTLLLAEPVMITVQIDGPTDRQFGVEFRKDPADEYPTSYRIDLREGDRAQFELDLPYDQIVRILYAGETIPLHIARGDRPELRFSGSDPRGSVSFSGPNRAKNEAVLEYFNRFVPTDLHQNRVGYVYSETARSRYDQAQTQSAGDYKKTVAKTASEATHFLNGRRAVLPNALYMYLAEDMRFRTAADKFAYFLMHSYPSESETQRAMKLHGSSANTFGDMTHPSYRNYLRTYAQYLSLPQATYNEGGAADRMMQRIPGNLSGEAGAFAQAEVLLGYFRTTGSTELADKFFMDYVEKNRQSAQVRRVIDGYEGNLNTMSPDGAPNIEMMRADNQVVNLSDYQGRVVYISFWASWCKPCIANFKKSADLRQDLQDMGVVLLNVSIDSDEPAFRRGLKLITPVGINALALDQNQTKRDYNLATIPAYYIIGKNGQFTYLSDGADRDIREEFRKLTQR